MSGVATRITPPSLWFTSRTPHDLGQRVCAYKRYLEYHAGPHGTGYRRRASNVPLATGSAVHVGAELLADWILEYKQKHRGMPPPRLPREVIAWAATEAAVRYETSARARGYAEPSLAALEQIGVDGVAAAGSPTSPQGSTGLPPAIETTILEQRTLIEAQVWLFALVYLPQMLQSHRLIGSEVEEILILDCTCGLSSAVLDWRAHEARGCLGIAQQGRADYLWEAFIDVDQITRGQTSYHEFKTKATPQVAWEKAWEHSGQLLVNMELASRRLGAEIDHAMIVVLFKGWRGKDRYAGSDPTAVKYQHSPLCYGYYKPPVDALAPGDWRATYDYIDEWGKNRKLGKDYQRAPIWEETRPLAGTPEQSRVERWIARVLSSSEYPMLVKTLGPFPKPSQRVEAAITGILAEETSWRWNLAEIREDARTTDEQDVAAAVIARSWNCTDYSGDPCVFTRLCNKEPGWEQPLQLVDGLGRPVYEIRRPHHQPEREAWEAKGAVFPVDDLDEAEVETE